MEPSFWERRWRNREIGFHEGEPNRLLLAHAGALDLKPGSRVFVPLCGKSRDIGWLLGNGYRVAGIDLSRIAADELFAELAAVPQISGDGAIAKMSTEGIDIFVGDVFALDAARLGPVDAVYDRAALVALPEPMRYDYAAHLAAITARAPQLLITFSYDQTLFEGPPFSVGEEEVARVHGERFEIERLEEARHPGGVKGHAAVDDLAFLLTAKTA